MTTRAQLKQLEISERIYIDSNIWFSYITRGKYDKTFPEVKKLIESKLNDDQSKIVISELVILEVINVINSRVAQREPFIESIKSDNNIAIRLQSSAQKYITEFMAKITQSTLKEKIEVAKEERSLSEVYGEIQIIQNDIMGEFYDVYKCKICRADRKSYNYSGVNHYDILHAIIARDSGVDCLTTADKGFRFLAERFSNSFKILLLDKDGTKILKDKNLFRV